MYHAAYKVESCIQQPVLLTDGVFYFIFIQCFPLKITNQVTRKRDERVRR